MNAATMAPLRQAAVAPFDVEAIRRDFPLLARTVHGKPLSYLDNAASSQRPRAVIESVSHYYETNHANVHRGVHTLSQEATDLYEGAREKVRRFINANSTREIVFVRGTTEAVNLVAQSYGRKHVGAGDEVLVTGLEHHSNIVPWQLLAAEKGATIRWIPVDSDGRLDLSGLDALLAGPVKILAVTQLSNAFGTINPVADLLRRAHAAGALVLIDGAQSVPHLGVDVQALDCDFLASPGTRCSARPGSAPSTPSARSWRRCRPSSVAAR